MKPIVYLASGWFNNKQKDQMEEIYRVLLELRLQGRVEFFAPFYDGIVLKGKQDPEWRKKMKEVWELDIQKVRESNLIIASTQDHDVGTIFECGYASCCKIPILCYNSNPELGLNVMLAQEARGFIKSPEQLLQAIESYLSYLEGAHTHQNDDPWRFNLWEGEPV